MNVNEHPIDAERTAAIAHEAGIQGDIDENSMYNVLGINALTVWTAQGLFDHRQQWREEHLAHGVQSA